jgi:hypothetical protein
MSLLHSLVQSYSGSAIDNSNDANTLTGAVADDFIGVAVVDLLQMQLVVVEVEVANHDGVVVMVNYSLLLHIVEGAKIYAML